MALGAQDKVEIQELSARYANAMDDADVQAWMNTWARDGVWEGGIGKFSGADKLREVLPSLGDRIKNRRHIMTNFVIEGDGVEATQRCYLLIVDRAKQAPPITAVYLDRLKKVDGRWLFAQRTVEID
jgi:hypothetical protein